MRATLWMAWALVAAAAGIAASGIACGSFSSDDDTAGSDGGALDGAAQDGAAKDSSAGDALPNADGALADASIDTGAARHLRVFVLASQWSIFDGKRNTADDACNAEAMSAGLAPSFVAWMSTSSSDAIERLPTDADWSQLVNGITQLVFPSRSYIESGSLPLKPLLFGANGLPSVDGGNRVWTGTNEKGRATGDDCSNWGIFSSGTAGRTNTAAAAWTNATSDDCGQAYHLYCFGL